MSRRLGVIGGYETAATTVLIIIIASLSVCGAFLIYRAVKGQRRKRDREEHTDETGKDTPRGARDRAKSTGTRGAGGEEPGGWGTGTGTDAGLTFGP